MGQKLHDDFLKLFSEKNSDGTLHLRLKGRELFQRIGTRLKAEDMHKIAAFLISNPEIISLDMCYNNIGDKGLKILSENFFNQDNKLAHINLMCCDIRAEGMKSFSSSAFLKLKSCRINGNNIGAEGARYIAKLIQNCPTLENIDIAETEQTLESIESILIVIEDSTLKAVDISRIIPASYYTKFNTATLADDIGVVLKLNSTLVEIHIQKCHIDGHDIELLLSGLEANKILEMLDLGCNHIGDLGVEYLAQWLKRRPALRALNLSSNSIKNFGARALSFGLPFSKVRFLDISNNNIEDLGLTDLLDTIKKYCRMRILFMWGNNFGAVACKRLSRMLKSEIIEQEYIDVRIYEVDGELHAAYYPTNHYKHKYYGVMDYGCRVELKIKRNEIPDPLALPRELLNFRHIGRYPPVDKRLGLLQKKVKECPS
nr:leucine-rich repeat-containing protein 34 [Leptinotarsa decemlineata]